MLNIVVDDDTMQNTSSVQWLKCLRDKYSKLTAWRSVRSLTQYVYKGIIEDICLYIFKYDNRYDRLILQTYYARDTLCN